MSLTSNTILTLILHSWNKSLLNLIESTNSCLKMSAWLDLLKEQMILLMFCASNDWQYPTFDKSNNVKIANSIVHCIAWELYIHLETTYGRSMSTKFNVNPIGYEYLHTYISEYVYSQFRLCENYNLVLQSCTLQMLKSQTNACKPSPDN